MTQGVGRMRTFTFAAATRAPRPRDRDAQGVPIDVRAGGTAMIRRIPPMIRRFLVLAAVVAIALWAASAAWAAEPGNAVLFFSPAMGKQSQQAKYQAIARAGAEAGVEVHYRFVDEVPPADAAELFSRYRLVIFDALAGPDALAPLVSSYGAALAANPTLASIASGLPGSPLTRNVGEGVETELPPYLANGGRENFRRLAGFLRVRLLNQEGAIEPAVTFPNEALYHPDAPDLVFSDTAAYLQWRAIAPEQPLVAVIFHRNHLAADSLAPIDATIRGLERRGIAVLPYYSDITTDYLGEKFLMRDGKPLASVIITHQAMVMNAETVRGQAARIGVPILHALHYRGGDLDAWRQDPSGIHMTQVPMALVMPEIIGFSDPLVVAEQDGAATRRMEPIPEQLDALLAKAAGLVKLTRMSNAEKKLAVVFYNYPPGVSNLGAAFLDVPASLARLTSAMRERGYTVEPQTADWFEKNAWATLKPFYADDVRTTSGDLLGHDQAELFPLAAYRKWYDRLPADVRRDIEARWGAPEQSRMIVVANGARHFAIPRMRLGNVIVLPQPRRNESETAKDDSLLYHDTNIPVTHSYLATYLWLREQAGIDALVHLGTHGTQEWLRGKERGLSVFDDPYLIVGDTPVFYPYITDNLAEGLQAKRRGRAVLVSHLTPPFAVTGTFDELSEIARLVNDYATAGVESLKEKTFREILERAVAANLHKDMGWDEARANADRAGFIGLLQDYLMGLSNQAQPLGTHVLGTLPKREHLVSTLALMLGSGFREAADGKEALQARDYTAFASSRAAQLLGDYVLDGKDPGEVGDATLRGYLESARGHYRGFLESDEIGSLLSGLEGHYVPTGYGGDVVRNPALLPTGRNMYSFDPAKVPTRSAWETGRKLAEQTLEDYRAQHGRYPEKLTFNLWSLETMRHFGVMEAQILALMGVRPVWNDKGMVDTQLDAMIKARLGFLPDAVAGAVAGQVTGDRIVALTSLLPESVRSRLPLARLKAARNFGRDDISGVEVIPASELKRPRIDVVVSVTGLYRDTFPGTMMRIAEAAEKVAALDEPRNALRRNALALRQMLGAQGVPDDEADKLSKVRVFSSQVGQYGNGVSDTVAASGTWDDDGKVARNYLERLGYYFGTDESAWGSKRAGLDLYAKNLAGTDAVMFSRTTNLYGLLTSDDPYGYFGALSLAVRTVSGRSPDSLIANLRDADNPVMEPTARFMAKELRGRAFHPQWITAHRDQGYAGTLEVLEVAENLWGWQVVDPTAVRDDQWQAFHDVYMRDALDLGVREWFEEKNPRALAQIAERMLEAVRKGYWRTDAETLRELVEVVEDAMRRFDFQPMNEKVMPFAEQLKREGYGLDFVAPAPGKQAALAPRVEGQLLEKVEPASETPAPARWLEWLFVALLAAVAGAGGARQAWWPRTWRVPRVRVLAPHGRFVPQGV